MMEQIRISDVTMKQTGKDFSLSFKEKIEIPKLLDLCEIFQTKLDDLLRQNMAARANIYDTVRIEQVEGFRMAQYVMISPNPEDDVMAYMDAWAKRSGLMDLQGHTPKRIGWDFPFVSSEQKNRFHLRGYACGYVLPEGFEPDCPGAEIVCQDSAQYAVMTIRDPFAAAFDRIPHAYQMILEYLQSNGIKKSAKAGVLPCFEYVYEKDGLVHMDVYIHCDSAVKANAVTNFT